MNFNWSKAEELETRTVELIHQVNNSDDIGKTTTWPAHYVDLLRNTHKGNSERFRLWNFLWRNGVDAELAAQWVTFNGEYDAAAISSLRRNVKLTQSEGGGTELYKYKSWILDTQVNI